MAFDPIKFEQLENSPRDSASTEIDFTTPKTYGTKAAPLTATTLTETNVGAQRVTQVIFQQGASLTVPGTWVKGVNSGDHDTVNVNIIYVEHFSDTYKRYTIDQDV